MGRQTTYSVTAYLAKEDYERIRRKMTEVRPPVSQSKVVRDYIIGGFGAEDALKAGAETVFAATDRYPAKGSKPPAR
jgi:hypothetical protein